MCDELLVLALVAPAAVTNLRAQVEDEIFAIDASPAGAGATRARLWPGVGRELYRHAEQRGYYTRLSASRASALAGFGADVVDARGGCPPRAWAPPPGLGRTQ